MRSEERNITVWIAVDGKEFPTQGECERYEMTHDLEQARKKRIATLFGILACYKRGHSWSSLSRTQGERMRTKAAFLDAARGKRRYTRRFAEKVRKAADNYIIADDQYKASLENYRAALAELKQLCPNLYRVKRSKSSIQKVAEIAKGAKHE